MVIESINDGHLSRLAFIWIGGTGRQDNRAVGIIKANEELRQVLCHLQPYRMPDLKGDAYHSQDESAINPSATVHNFQNNANEEPKANFRVY